MSADRWPRWRSARRLSTYRSCMPRSRRTESASSSRSTGASIRSGQSIVIDPAMAFGTVTPTTRGVMCSCRVSCAAAIWSRTSERKRGAVDCAARLGASRVARSSSITMRSERGGNVSANDVGDRVESSKGCFRAAATSRASPSRAREHHLGVLCSCCQLFMRRSQRTGRQFSVEFFSRSRRIHRCVERRRHCPPDSTDVPTRMGDRARSHGGVWWTVQIAKA